jgi:hypothetical protein
MITRRDFIKGMAVLFSSPAIAKLDILEAKEHIEYLGKINGVMIDSLGKRIARNADGSEYPVLVYHLKRGDIEAYAEIDKQLMDFSGDPEGFIRIELEWKSMEVNEAGGWA